MRDSYTLKTRIKHRIDLALAYSKAIEVVQTKTIKNIILINN